MASQKLIWALALFSSAVLAQNNQAGNSSGQQNQGQNNNNNNNDQNQADATQLAPDAIQTGSFFDGQQALGASDEQVESEISQNNFINICAGKTLTNGLQLIDGSCNGIPMGEIPSKQRMISSIIINPKSGEAIQEGTDFTIQVQTINLQAGAFTNAVATYYSAPQRLNGGGQIIGHTHITVQDLGLGLNPTTPPDPTQFVFFQGINDAGNGNGLLAADVVGGLPAGNYRVCTLTSGSNHQPVVMPVAQRGAQDDCTKFTVSANAAAANANNQQNQGQNNNRGQGNNQQNQGQNGNKGQGQQNNNRGQGQNNQQNQGQNNKQGNNNQGQNNNQQRQQRQQQGN